jgi:hypothetical protein
MDMRVCAASPRSSALVCLSSLIHRIQCSVACFCGVPFVLAGLLLVTQNAHAHLALPKFPSYPIRLMDIAFVTDIEFRTESHNAHNPSNLLCCLFY